MVVPFIKSHRYCLLSDLSFINYFIMINFVAGNFDQFFN